MPRQKGFSSEYSKGASYMDFKEYVEKIGTFVSSGAWDRLEDEFHKVCVDLAGDDYAKRIEAVDVNEYENEIQASIEHAVDQGEDLDIAAIYFEYNLDNGWEGVFFLCSDYNSEEDNDDDWARDWEKKMEGPVIPEFADIYQENNGTQTKEGIGATAYMIARTVAAIGRAIEEIDTGGLAVAVGYKDQDFLMHVVD